MRKFNNLSKVVCMVLVCAMCVCSFSSVAKAGEKRTSWVSTDGKKLYRATITSEKVKAKVVPISFWQKKRDMKKAMSISVSTSVEQSMSASAQFTGTAKGTLADLSASIGLSVTKAVGFTTQYEYTVDKDDAIGLYRIVLVWPGERVRGVVTEEPNGNGYGGQIMSNDSSKKLPPKKKVINDCTVQYAPKKNDAYIDFQYKKQ